MVVTVGILFVGGYFLRLKLVALILTASLLLGIARSSAVYGDYLALRKFDGQKREFVGRVVADPTEKIGRIEVVVSDIEVGDRKFNDGFIKSSLLGGRELRRGDKVKISAKLSLGYGIYALKSSYSQVELLDRQTRQIDNLRLGFIKSIEVHLPGDSGQLMAGMILGSRSKISEELQEQMRSSGLTHLVAVSGYNLTILANFVTSILKSRSRKVTLVLSTFAVLLFAAAVGPSGSVLRATVVSIMGILAGFTG